MKFQSYNFVGRDHLEDIDTGDNIKMDIRDIG
jgi:hypothetical protein